MTVHSRLMKISKDLAAAAGDFEKAIREAAEAAVETLSSFEKALAGEYEVPDAEPDENPVRPIGIRKGRWENGRRIR